MKAPRLATAGTVAGSAVLVLTALASPASAHVGVQPETTPAKGGFTVVDFKVPNERDNASTTKLEISFPAEHPLASVMPQPMEGWTVQVTRSKLTKPIQMHSKTFTEAVTKVTWTAAGKGIEPGYFQKFPVSIGALPEDTDQLVFKALQTYSNKEVVRWIEVPQQGQQEPENPAPVLKLAAAADDDHHGTTAEDATGDAKPATLDSAADPAASKDGGDSTARVLGAAGVLLGAAGVAYGVYSGRRRTSA